MLYEMVLGRLPFKADTPYGLIFKHISEAPPRPREIDPGLPAAVEAVLLKALDKDPDKRFQSALDMAAAFVDALPQEPAVTAQAEQQAAEKPAGVQDTPTEYAEATLRAYATPGQVTARLSPQRMAEGSKIVIGDAAGDDRASIPTTNAYMHYALRALEEVAGLQATEVILRFAGLEAMLDAYPPNNLKLSKHTRPRFQATSTTPSSTLRRGRQGSGHAHRPQVRPLDVHRPALLRDHQPGPARHADRGRRAAGPAQGHRRRCSRFTAIRAWR
jgi:hypothetical protein